jgi:hypothetical protein
VTLLGTQAFDDAWDSVLSSYEKPSGGLLTSSERAEIIGHMATNGDMMRIKSINTHIQ